MKKAIIISFYESSNLGDLELSSSIDKILKDKDYNLTRYNFTTGIRFENKEKFNLGNTNGFVFNVLKIIKFLMKFILGRVKYDIMVWKHITSKIWDKNTIFNEDFKQTDIVVFAGGNMIMDTSPAWPYLIKKYIDKANYFNKPFYFLYVGVGPLKYKNSKKVLGKSLRKVKGISVRDEMSKKIINGLVDPCKVILTADPVFSNPIKFKNKTFKKNEYLNIGICVLGEMCFVSKNEFLAYIKNLELLVERLSKSENNSLKIILFSTELLDYKAIEYLQSKIINNKYVTINKVRDLNDLYELYDGLNFLVGGRMHSMILAQKRLLPFMGIIWQDKIKGFSILTNSVNKMYTIKSLKEELNYIVNLIEQQSVDEKILLEMDKTNMELQRIVTIGDIII
ncbi:MAG: polysaccharide pyruvyl transferase family protein [Lutibacter sp.]|nr:polysaccharide pyruvyl transferase family protein [Lutibacter sp.]